MTAIVKFKPTHRVADWALSLAVSALLAACNMVSLWSVGDSLRALSLESF